MKKAVYAGSFDPITKGHEDIISRALKIVDKIVVLVMDNPKKNYWFTPAERRDMVREVFKDNENILVENYNGLMVDYMLKNNIFISVKGIRSNTDFEYELRYNYANKGLSHDKIETIFLPSDLEYMYLSSSLVREIAVNKGNFKFCINDMLEDKIKKRAELIMK